MPARNVNLTASGQAKLEWLRAAAKEGFDAAERRDVVALRSENEISGFRRKIREEVTAEIEAEYIGCGGNTREIR